MKHPAKNLLKEHFQIHNRFSSEEYLIDHKTYRYILEFIKISHEPIHLLPDDEYISAKKLLDDEHTEMCKVRINEMVFV